MLTVCISDNVRHVMGIVPATSSIGVATCSEKDSFSPLTGIKVALIASQVRSVDTNSVLKNKEFAERLLQEPTVISVEVSAISMMISMLIARLIILFNKVFFSRKNYSGAILFASKFLVINNFLTGAILIRKIPVQN